MSVSAPLTSAPTPMECPSGSPTTVEVDTSGSLPLFLMLVAGVFWLCLGSALGLIASVKLHAPAMLSGIPALTYGRLIPAQNALFLYGFAAQVGLGIALWIVSRLGRAKVVAPFILTVGALLWNVGILTGLLNILAGNWTGLNRFEMPISSVTPLFVGYGLIGIAALLTFKARTARDLYPSMWFILASLFWFPWIYGTASYLLHSGFLRASAVPVIAGWYGQNFVSIVLLSLALGASYYFIPKLSHQPLASRGLAIFGFWSLLIFAPFGGFAATYAVPRWVISMSVVSSVLCLVPIAAHSWNWIQTLHCTRSNTKEDFGLLYFRIAIPFLALYGIFAAWAAFPANNTIVGFTWLQTGLVQMLEYGFIGLVLLGSVVVVAPKLTQTEWTIRKLLKPHCLLSIIGVVFMTLPLLLGGWIQGQGLNDAAIPFVDASKRAFPFVAMTTIGILLFALAQALLLLHLLALCGRSLMNCCQPAAWFAVNKGGAR